MIWLYRFLWIICGPLVDIIFFWRLFKGKESWERMSERVGITDTTRPGGDVIWIHGASVGEMKSLFPLIDIILKQNTDTHILLTSGTTTSAALVADKLAQWQGRVIHQMAPLDFGLCVHWFLKYWSPQISVFVESEFWPEYLYQAPNPMLINARVTARSYQKFKRFGFFFKPLLARLTAAYAQTETIAERLKALGVSNVSVAPNIKIDAELEIPNESLLKKFTQAVNNRPVVCFASTHQPEDEIVGAIHRALREEIPDILSIVVPRHAHRGNMIAQTLTDLGLSTRQRQNNQKPDPQTDVYIADSMGEMALWYALSDVVVMGGSFFPHGGQNPLEPLILGKPTFSGPHMFNFESLIKPLKTFNTPESYEELAKLIERIITVLEDKALRSKLEKNNLKAIGTLSGGSQHAADAILKALEKAS